LRDVIFTSAPIRRRRSRIVSASAFAISAPARPMRRSAQVSACAIADIAMRTALPCKVGVERRTAVTRRPPDVGTTSRSPVSAVERQSAA
jgi:hypothetical protein